jgi:hypothetical protein
MYHEKNILQNGNNMWHGILLIMNIEKTTWNFYFITKLIK